MTDDKMDLGIEKTFKDLEESDVFGVKKTPKEKDSASFGGIPLKRVW